MLALPTCRQVKMTLFVGGGIGTAVYLTSPVGICLSVLSPPSPYLSDNGLQPKLTVALTTPNMFCSINII